MSTKLARVACVVTAGFMLGMGGGQLRARTLPGTQDRDQGHDQDYSKNKNYQLGMRDGQNDHKRKLDHSKKRHFKKDEDQRAYEVGYQAGNRDDHH